MITIKTVPKKTGNEEKTTATNSGMNTKLHREKKKRKKSKEANGEFKKLTKASFWNHSSLSALERASNAGLQERMQPASICATVCCLWSPMLERWRWAGTTAIQEKLKAIQKVISLQWVPRWKAWPEQQWSE
jgi:hypothetical protein